MVVKIIKVTIGKNQPMKCDTFWLPDEVLEIVNEGKFFNILLHDEGPKKISGEKEQLKK